MTHEVRSSAAPNKRWFPTRRHSLLSPQYSRSTHKQRRPPTSRSTRQSPAPVTEAVLCCYRNLSRSCLLNVTRPSEQQFTPWSKPARLTAQKKQTLLRLWPKAQLTRQLLHKSPLSSWNGSSKDGPIYALASSTSSNSAQLRAERATKVGRRNSCSPVTLKAIQRTS